VGAAVKDGGFSRLHQAVLTVSEADIKYAMPRLVSYLKAHDTLDTRMFCTLGSYIISSYIARPITRCPKVVFCEDQRCDDRLMGNIGSQ
jgi:hypothetical protein